MKAFIITRQFSDPVRRSLGRMDPTESTSILVPLDNTYLQMDFHPIRKEVSVRERPGGIPPATEIVGETAVPDSLVPLARTFIILTAERDRLGLVEVVEALLGGAKAVKETEA